MVTQIREAQSAVTKDDVLRLIIRYQFEQARMPIFRRPPLPSETDWALVVGTIGERGGGKSGSDAVLAVVDHMIFGKRCFSNMKIVVDIEVDDETACKYGLKSGGVVRYESELLIKDALLQLDDRYRKSCILIEEINVQYSNVRRFMSNTNVDFNEVCQQLRKFEASLLFNVIDEMFIDPQLRSLSDIFIKTYDSAFDVGNLQNRKPRGLDFMWKVYPMSAYLRGEQNKYAVTNRSLDGICFHFGAWRGIFNSMIHQEKGIYSISTKDKNKALTANVTAESSPEIKEHFNEWGWLYKEVASMNQAGIKEIGQLELYDRLNIDPDKEKEANDYLIKAMRLKAKSSGGRRIYMFPDRVFNRERVPVLV